MIYQLSDFPQARHDDRIHTQDPEGGPRAFCGAGYNWETDLQFTDDHGELTCGACAAFAEVAS